MKYSGFSKVNQVALLKKKTINDKNKSNITLNLIDTVIFVIHFFGGLH